MKQLNKKNEGSDELSMYNYFLSLEIPFKCGRINMWSNSNIYDYIPNFKFKFLGLDKNHNYYLELIDIVNKFNGNICWELITFEKSSNYILKPKIDNTNLSNNLKNDIYKKDIEKAIDDISFLIEHFKKEISFMQTKR